MSRRQIKTDISRRGFLKAGGAAVGAAAGIAAFGPMSRQAAAQSGWKPTGPVEFVVGTGQGGGNDVTARTIQKILKEANLVEQPITVFNKPGAGGARALDYLSKAEVDGNTIAIGNPTLLSSHITGRSQLTYTDVTPLVVLQQQYVGYAVKADSPLKTGLDLVERLKKDPKSVSIAIGAAVGNQNHISLAKAAKAVGVKPKDLKTVIFKSGGESLTAALGGHVDVGITSAGAFVPHIEAGKMRLIAVAAPERLGGVLASVPTWKEMLNTEVVAGNWYTYFGPKGLGAEQVAFWENAFEQMVKQKAWVDYMDNQFSSLRFMKSAATADFYKSEYESLKEILTDLGLAA